MRDDEIRDDIDRLQREAYSNNKNALERHEALEDRVRELERQVRGLTMELEREAKAHEDRTRALIPLLNAADRES